jgi:hypothetical protein
MSRYVRRFASPAQLILVFRPLLLTRPTRSVFGRAVYDCRTPRRLCIAVGQVI